MNKSTIKKLNEIFKLGHLPSRNGEDYSIMTFEFINCFAHACLNLTDKEIVDFDISEMNSREFGNFFRRTKEDTSQQIINTLTQAGLKVEPCDQDKVLKPNQWKVALYFEFFHTINKDFHFLIQEKDGSWSGKVGYSRKCHIFNYLPKEIEAGKCFYLYYGTYCLTNPYAEKTSVKKTEKSL